MSVRLAFAVLLLVGAVSSGEAQRHHRPLLVASVRADGIILPFAVWDSGRWSPIQRDTLGFPSFIPPIRWSFINQAGATSRLSTGSLVENKDDVFGQDEWGYTSTATPVDDEELFPRGRVGMAVSDSLRLTRVPAREPVPAVAARVRREVLRLLDSVVMAQGAQFATPVPPGDAIIVRLDGFAVPGEGRMLVVVGAQRPLPRRPDRPGCPRNAVFFGLVSVGVRVSVVGEGPRLQECGKPPDYAFAYPVTQPFAVFEHAGRRFVLGWIYGHDETYSSIWEWSEPGLDS